MSVCRCPFILKTSTFTVKDSAKTLSLKYVCQTLDITNVENCFAKNNTRRDIAQKKAGYPCGIACLSTYPTERV